MRELPSRNVVVTCAVTGALHTPTMSPHLPITPDEIVEECVAASEAGASIVHVHVRDPETGEPVSDLELFSEVARRVNDRTDVIVQPSTGGSPTMEPEERVAVVPELDPEMCSCNMGSINYALYPLAERYDDWKHEWEADYLAETKDSIFKNTFEDLDVFLNTMRGHDTVPCLGCYDVGHLYNVRRCLDHGWLDPPIYLEFVFGIDGGIGVDPSNLAYMKAVAEELFDDAYSFSVIPMGTIPFPLALQSVSMGGHVRVGLEDNLYVEEGVLATSNAELVSKTVEQITAFTDREPATPDEVREFLDLKGRSRTAFS
ncbi:BKACE family enzyme [Natrarchaeobius oligotrophus]|uniref:3-keto-5-aminohexanoate cleavage protein n=1 Tax=Natrarchaeobius chitinivorans TaxID=1679083 RepID=A0A3N6MWR5_NATCH|nr:3-keto-5-aminohexanoate cleavage protein [Natrarchaeobius chitinivorans]RQG99426.1 3-keto-5-aminohexanoate cleavage protein [Natrarchaeobius chitinivorans]